MASAEPLLPVSSLNRERSLSFTSQGNHKRTVSQQVCVCGSRFMDDAVFCRKCGKKRPKVLKRADSAGESPLHKYVMPDWLENTDDRLESPKQVDALRRQPSAAGLRRPVDFILGRDNVWAPPKPQHVAKGSHFRLFDRSALTGTHGQRRTANVLRVNRSVGLFLNDLFHVVLEIPTMRFIALFWLAYIVIFVIFAIIYWLASAKCGLGCDTFVDALFLSIETMMTIGYGVPDPFFKDCPWMLFPVLLQILLAVSLDGSLVGIVYQRISQGSRRSASILFSHNAVIRTIGEATYLMIQVCEMRNKQLLECNMRLYLFSCPFNYPGEHDGQDARDRRSDLPTTDVEGGRSRDEFASSPDCILVQEQQFPIDMQPLRLDLPDDSLGGMLLLALPTTIAHRIDAWSPLAGGVSCGKIGGSRDMDQPSNYIAPQRVSECDAGCRYTMSCEVCGDCFQRAEQFHRHLEYYGRPAANDAAHAELLARLPPLPSAGSIARDVRAEVRNVLKQKFVEVVCVLEGVDPVTSSSVQARHSYSAEEIVWDHDFADCVYDVVEDGGRYVCIDFDKFHDLVPRRKATSESSGTPCHSSSQQASHH